MGDRYASRGRSRATERAREDTSHGYGRRGGGPVQGRGDWRSKAAPGRPVSVDGDTDKIRVKLDALKLNEVMRGECEAMCSSQEATMRQQTKDISRFEIAPASVPSSSSSALPLPWAVKKYRRPAAGRMEIQPQELRPPRVLELTLQHLFTNVLPWTGCGFDWSSADADATAKPHDFLALYHFISDRVRSVRQDFVTQRVSGVSRIDALMQIARFYVLASFRAAQLLDFGDKPIDWSEPLNDQQLASALTEVHAQFQSMHSTQVRRSETMVQRQEEALALDVLLHLPDARAVSLLLAKANPSHLLARPGLRCVLRVFAAFQTGDYCAFTRRFRQLPLLQQCLALRHLAALWPRILTVMNKAYAKIDRFALTEIAAMLELSGTEDAAVVCRALHVHVEEPAAMPVSPLSAPALDSWEDAPLPLQAPATNSLRAEAVVQFKISAMRDDLEPAVAWGMLRRKAAAIQKTFATRSTTATDLVMATLDP